MVKKDTSNRAKYIELVGHDLFCFRSKACRRFDTPKGCEFGINKCQYSHQPNCIRRCPIYLSDWTKLRYLPLRCPDMDFESTHDECPRTKLCPYAHSQEEIDYHPLNYHKVKCDQVPCPRLYCSKSHRNTAPRPDAIYSLPFSRGCKLPEVKHVIFTDPEHIPKINNKPRKESPKSEANRQATPITPSGSTPTVSTITPSVLGGPSPLPPPNNSYLMPIDLLSPINAANCSTMLSPNMFPHHQTSRILSKAANLFHPSMSSSPSGPPVTPTDTSSLTHQYSAQLLSVRRTPLDTQNILKEGMELMDKLKALESDSTAMADVQAALQASNRIQNLLLGRSVMRQTTPYLQK